MKRIVFASFLSLSLISACSERPENRSEALVEAVVRDDLAAVRALLAKGADPNRRCPLGNEQNEEVTPLAAAVVLDRVAIAKELLARGADPRFEFRGIRITDFARRTGSYHQLLPAIRGQSAR